MAAYSASAAPLPHPSDFFAQDKSYRVGKDYQNAILKNLQESFEDPDYFPADSKTPLPLSGKSSLFANLKHFVF